MLILSVAISLLTAGLVFASGRIPVAIMYAVVMPGVLVLPKLFRQRLSAWQGPWGDERLRRLNRQFLVIVAMNAIGTLWLHALPYQYDRLLHFALAFLGIFMAATILFPGRGASPNRSRLMFWSISFVAIGFFVVELTQFGSDAVFGTKMFHDVAQPIEIDLAEDLLFDLLGATTATLLLIKHWDWWQRGLNGKKPEHQ